MSLGLNRNSTTCVTLICVVTYLMVGVSVDGHSFSLLAATEADLELTGNSEGQPEDEPLIKNHVEEDARGESGDDGTQTVSLEVEPKANSRGVWPLSLKGTISNQTEVQVDAEVDANKGNATSEPKVDCTLRNVSHSEISGVKLVNSSEILEYLEGEPTANGNGTQNNSECAVILFFYPWCPFSAKTAPHYNALGRVYPQLHVLALDAYAHNSINMRFGLVGVPSVLVFHKGKVVAKYNDSDPSLDGFVSFLQKVTGLSPVSSPSLTPEDSQGPVPSTPESRIDLVLLLSWLFIIICFSYLFGKSILFTKIVESVRNTWREAEAQHEHLD